MGRKASSKEEVVRKIVSERQPVGAYEMFQLCKCYKAFSGVAYAEIISFACSLDFIYVEQSGRGQRVSRRFSIKDGI